MHANIRMHAYFHIPVCNHKFYYNPWFFLPWPFGEALCVFFSLFYECTHISNNTCIPITLFITQFRFYQSLLHFDEPIENTERKFQHEHLSDWHLRGGNFLTFGIDQEFNQFSPYWFRAFTKIPHTHSQHMQIDLMLTMEFCKKNLLEHRNHTHRN